MLVSIFVHFMFLCLTVLPIYLLLKLAPLPHIARVLLACLTGGAVLALVNRDLTLAHGIALLLMCVWLLYLGRHKIAAENQSDKPTSLFKP